MVKREREREREDNHNGKDVELLQAHGDGVVDEHEHADNGVEKVHHPDDDASETFERVSPGLENQAKKMKEQSTLQIW
jgi:hypothetical protein